MTYFVSERKTLAQSIRQSHTLLLLFRRAADVRAASVDGAAGVPDNSSAGGATGRERAAAGSDLSGVDSGVVFAGRVSCVDGAERTRRAFAGADLHSAELCRGR